MSFTFAKAEKYGSLLRLGFIGPAGSGKTYSSLKVATELLRLIGGQGRIAGIDTERGSMRKYADEFDFDVCELGSHSPDDYVRAIRSAEDGGYALIVIDSLSHAWMGKGGALEMVDEHAKKERGNSFGAWRHVTPKHNAMVDVLVSCKAHLIVTMRSKTEWVIDEDSRGKKVPRKIGLAPVQRDGLEYEFDVVGDMDLENNFIVSKTRCPALRGKLIELPGAQLAATLHGWLAGRKREEEVEPAAAPGEDDPEGRALVERLELSIALRAAEGPTALEELKAELAALPETWAKELLRKRYVEAMRTARASASAPSSAPSSSPSPDSSPAPGSTGGPAETTRTTTSRGETKRSRGKAAQADNQTEAEGGTVGSSPASTSSPDSPVPPPPSGAVTDDEAREILEREREDGRR